MVALRMLALLALVALISLAGCGEENPATDPPGEPPIPGEGAAEPTPTGQERGLDTEWWERKPAVRLVLVGGQKGKLKPCGCSSPQMGGLARAASVLHQLRRRAEQDGTAVGALAAGWSLAGSLQPQEEAKADYVRAVYEQLGFEGVLLGDSDLRVPAMGVPRGAVGPAVPRPPVNVVLSDACTAAGTTPELKCEVGGIPLRAFSIADPARAEDLVEAGLVQAVPMLAGVFENLKPDPDTLWLATCDLADPELRSVLQGKLGQLGPAVIVSVAPHGFGVRKADRVPVQPGGAPLVVELDEYGKGLGVLDLEAAPDGKGWLASYRFIELVPQWEKYGGAPQALVESLDRLYRQMVREAGYLADVQRHPDEGPTYVGSSACAACHASIYNEWRRTPHAAALETLENSDYAWDPECIRCHVVGWERNADGASWTAWGSGFRTPDATPYLGGVGCESCHGPGAAHVSDPWNKDLFRVATAAARAGPNQTRPDRRACVRCHDPENSHGFEDGFEAHYLPAVDHRRVPKDLKTVVPEAAAPPK